MKVILIALMGCILTSGSISCTAQRDVNTSSARAAYAPPSSGHWAYTKKKSKKKKQKVAKTRKARSNDTDAARERRRGISGF